MLPVNASIIFKVFSSTLTVFFEQNRHSLGEKILEFGDRDLWRFGEVSPEGPGISGIINAPGELNEELTEVVETTEEFGLRIGVGDDGSWGVD